MSEELARFEVISNTILRAMLVGLPAALIGIVLIDWLVGTNVIAGDAFRLSTIGAAVVEVLLLRSLFEKVPAILRSLWTQGLIDSSQDSQPAAQAFSQYLRQFAATLNQRLAWMAGVLFSLLGLVATYPIRYFLVTSELPFTGADLAAYYLWGNAGFIAPLTGYFLGLLIWRAAVIALFITRLGRRFQLRILPGHPDQSGGLRGLGDLCLTLAYLLLLPALFLAYWGVVVTYLEPESLAIYTLLWSGLYRKWLLVLCVAALFFFLQPLYSIHLQMKRNRQTIQTGLGQLSRKMNEISQELQNQAHQLTPQEGQERLASLEFLEQAYQLQSRVPTWPFDWAILRKFIAAQAVPLLGLAGTSAPLIQLVDSLLSFSPQ